MCYISYSNFIMELKKLIIGAAAGAMMLGAMALPAFAAQPADKGFNENGYNYNARIFSGKADGVDKKLDGTVWGDPTYANDHLVMKWNSEWDRGNAEKWLKPPYAAWEDNEWNGRVPNGSGEMWHYKIVWDQGCATSGIPSTDATKGTPYCLWGPFATILSQGSAADHSHMWDVLMSPAGYGAY